MRTLLISLISIITILSAQSQNVGINTSTPAYPLTVAVPSGNYPGIVQKNGIAEMGLYTNSSTGAWLRSISDHDLNFGSSDYGVPGLKINYWGDVGIFTPTLPSNSHKLEIAGRLRLRHHTSTNQTAGIWFDGTTLPARSFIGTINDDHVGIWGSGGAGWNIAMNVENGNFGIGTSSPTEKLDVNGSVRFRAASVKKGSVLISADANGNAVWQEPIAFKAHGSSDGNSTSMPSDWVKYYFSSATDYNIGFHYNALTSEFIAPVKGVYHFNAAVAFEQNNRTYGIGITVVSPPNGVGYGVSPYKMEHNGSAPGGYGFESDEDVFAANSAHLSADIPLNPGDKVFVKVYRYENGDSINPDVRKTWFTGHLVCRL